MYSVYFDYICDDFHTIGGIDSMMGNVKNNQSFVFGVSVSDYNFIGREDEIRQLRMNFEEGINTILISPRRWGKTSLVKRVCQEVDKKKIITVFVDIFKCKTEYEL